MITLLYHQILLQGGVPFEVNLPQIKRRSSTSEASISALARKARQLSPDERLEAFFNHSNLALNLRFAESVFITPRIHRMHHNPNWTARKNYGTVFVFWDLLFGTLERGEIDSSVSGVPDERETYPQTWFPQFLKPFRQFAVFSGKGEEGP